jgi:hypothetical protein
MPDILKEGTSGYLEWICLPSFSILLDGSRALSNDRLVNRSPVLGIACRVVRRHTAKSEVIQRRAGTTQTCFFNILQRQQGPFALTILTLAFSFSVITRRLGLCLWPESTRAFEPLGSTGSNGIKVRLSPGWLPRLSAICAIESCWLP